MALTNLITTLVLDVYHHDQTQDTIKAIALDSHTRYVKATLTDEGTDYPVDENATVTLTILRPDKVGVQVTGSVVDVDNADRTGTIKGVYAELSQASLAVSGKLQAQFKVEVGQQILRTEIFLISNGVALDGETSEWADTYQGYDLEEFATVISGVENMTVTSQTLPQGQSATVTKTEDAEGVVNLEFGLPLASGEVQVVNVSGMNPSITAEYNKRYVCGEVSTLTITPAIQGCTDVLFTSGTTPTVLNLPQTVKMPSWFTVEANKTYEISILDGIYGAVMSWT